MSAAVVDMWWASGKWQFALKIVIAIATRSFQFLAKTRSLTFTTKERSLAITAKESGFAVSAKERGMDVEEVA